MAKIFYEEEKIRAIAEKIREKTATETTYTTEGMPSGIDDVYINGFSSGHTDGYHEGYEDGFSEGEANGKPILYGTYMLARNPQYEEQVEISEDFRGCRVYGYFYNGSEYVYEEISEFYATQGFEIYSGVSELWTCAYSGEWHASGGIDFPDEQYRVIDFQEPMMVSAEMYSIFMSLVDNTDVTPYDVGEQAGKQAQYNEFWDAALDPNLNWQQRFTGAVWNDITFKPNQDIKPRGSANHLFNLAEITDLVAILQECGVTLDTSGVYVRGDRMFNWCTKLTTVPYIDVSNVTYSSGITEMFICDYALHTVEGLRLRDDGSLSMENAFEQCNSLVNLTIYGTIGTSTLNLRHCTKLSRASITSVINALSDTTSGLSITLSQTAKMAAVSEAIAAGDNLWWNRLINSKPNWTINTV